MELLIFLVVGVLATRLAVVVWRPAHERADQRALGAIFFIDGALAFGRACLVALGFSVASTEAIRLAATGNLLIGILSVRFAWGFPTNRPVPRWLDLSLILGGLAVAWTLGQDIPHGVRYFVQVCGLATLALFAHRWWSTRRVRALAGSGWVMGLLTLRWLMGVVAINLYLHAVVSPALGEAILQFERTALMLAVDAALVFAILRHQLFRLRGFVVEQLLFAGLVLSVGMLSLWAIDTSLRHVDDHALRVLALLTTLLVCTLLATLALRVAPGVRARLHAAEDGHQETVLARVAQAAGAGLDGQALRPLVDDAMTELTGSAGTVFLEIPGTSAPASAPRLETGVALRLRGQREPFLRVADAPGLTDEARDRLLGQGIQVLVPVRRGAMLYGAYGLTVVPDNRAVLFMAGALADELALALENDALVEDRGRMRSELDAARPLAHVGTFVAAIAHDLRTPLTSVQMNVQMLRAKVRLPPEDMEHFNLALGELTRLDAHIGDLLEYAKPVRLSLDAVSLPVLVAETFNRLTPASAHREVALVPQVAPDLPLLQADPARLRRVLQNLVSNAIEASPAGGQVVVSARATPQRVVVEVTDQGRGIPEEHRGRVFEPFFTTRVDGTGLGLAIVQKLVRAHGGSVSVAASAPSGTVFSFELPIASR